MTYTVSGGALNSAESNPYYEIPAESNPYYEIHAINSDKATGLYILSL